LKAASTKRAQFRSVASFRRTRLALQAAKARGVKLGGTNAQSIANRNEANRRAKELRPILTELASLSANKAAAELNRRGVATPQGGQ
jgi:DNA invertase Pin-like site-specific DNA recombinase